MKTYQLKNIFSWNIRKPIDSLQSCYETNSKLKTHSRITNNDKITEKNPEVAVHILGRMSILILVTGYKRKKVSWQLTNE